jgi:hypothetical protein
MSESNFTRIYTGSFINVQAIVAGLEDAGISSIIKDETESARLAGFGATNPGVQQLLVHNDKVTEAVKIVEAFTANL